MDSTRIENALEKAKAAGANDDVARLQAMLDRARSKLDAEMSLDGTHPVQAEQEARDASGAFLRTGLPQGLTLGAADEMQSFVTGENVDAIRARNAEREAEHPNAVMAGEMTGALLPSMVPIGGAISLARSAPLAVKMAAGGAAGTSVAAVEGFNKGTGNVLDPDSTRLSEASNPARLGAGATMGVAAPVAGTAIGRVAGALTSRKTPNMRAMGVDSTAARLASRAFRDDAQYIDDVDAYMAKLGDEGMIADLGPNSMQQARGLATIPGAGAQQVVKAMRERSAGQADRLAGDVDRALGTAEDLTHQQNVLQAARASNARVNYDFEGKDVEFDPFLKDSLGRLETLSPGVVRKNRRIARADKVPLKREIIDEDVDYTLTPDELEALDHERDVGQFFDRYDELTEAAAKMQRRPVSAEIIKRGGIDPTGKIGRELAGMGLKPSDYPGLFRKGGLTDLDNIPLNEGPAVFSERYPGESGYIPEQDLIDALNAESRAGVRDSAGREIFDEIAAMEKELPQYERWRQDMGQGVNIPFPGDQKKEVIGLTGLDYLTRNVGKSFREGSNEQRVATNITKDIESRYPDLQSARKAYAEDSAVMEAAERGNDLFKSEVSPDKFRADWGKMSERERVAFKMAARSEIENMMAGAVREAQIGRNKLGTRATLEKIRVAFGDDATEILNTRLDAEPIMQETANRVKAGSDTAASRAAQGELMPLLDETGQRKGPVGRARQAAGNVGNAVVDALLGRVPQRASADLGKALTAQGAQRDALIRALMADQGQFIKADRREEIFRKIAQHLTAGGGGALLSQQ